MLWSVVIMCLFAALIKWMRKRFWWFKEAHDGDQEKLKEER